MTILLQIALGGALGAVSRYGAGALALRVFGPAFPIGTLAVNVVGSLAMGIAYVLLAARTGHESSPWLPFIMTGFLGGFTTFSAFSLDTFALIEKGRFAAAGVYVGGSVALSIVALVVGIALARGLAT